MFLYFGPSAVSERPPKPTGVAGAVVDREHEPRPEAVLQPVRPVHEREPGRHDVVARELPVVEVTAQRVVAVRRPAEHELARRVTVEAAAAQVAARATTGRLLEQDAVVEVDRRAAPPR